MSKNNKFSGRDVNDKLMKSAGFVRDSLDSPTFNACGNITYWINKDNVRIITNKSERLSLLDFLDRFQDAVIYKAVQKINHQSHINYRDFLKEF